MKILSIAVLSSGLFVSGAAFAAPVPTAPRSILTNNNSKDWMTTIVQENEGIPNPDGSRCVLLSRPVAGPRGHFVGYHSFTACR